MSRLLLIALAVSLFSACVEYNDACTAPVDDANATIARLKDPIFIDKPNARHDNNAFGQAAADAFKNAFTGAAEAQLGIINSGDLRAEGYCQPRNVLRGRITNSDVYEVLLFDNLVYSLEVTEQELVDSFQHSVASLTRATSTGPQEIAAPPARFLQVSKEVSMTVDCNLPTNRVTRLTISGKDVLTAPSTTTRYRVAMPEFLMLGGDGYGQFKKSYDERGVWNQTARNEKEAQITASYLAKTYGDKDPPLEVEKRIILENCAVPLPPAAN